MNLREKFIWNISLTIAALVSIISIYNFFQIGSNANNFRPSGAAGMRRGYANGGEVLLTYPDSGASPTGAQAMRVKLVSATRSTNLNAENYIGIATATVSDGASASVAIAGGTDDAQSSLTPAQAYYVQIDGTLATTPDSPRVFAGTALTSTTIAIGKTDHENDGRVFIGGYDFRRASPWIPFKWKGFETCSS